MFMFDVETLGKQSHSVILSAACIHFDPKEKYSFENLIDNAFFVKFDVEDQIKRLKRSTGRSTMEWWAKQCDIVKERSFIPNKFVDVKFEDGYEQMREWAKSFNENKSWVWARGNLDQLVMDDIEEQCGLTPIFPYARWRDVRTAVDIFYDTDRGYVNVPDFDPQAYVIKHCPIHDCAYDIMQLLYGEKNGNSSD